MNFLKTLLITTFLISSLFAGFYSVGDYISTADQNISMTTCYPGNGYEDGDEWKLGDWNGATNGGNHNVIYISMAASW